jgi:hypothetical protein
LQHVLGIAGIARDATRNTIPWCSLKIRSRSAAGGPAESTVAAIDNFILSGSFNQ